METDDSNAREIIRERDYTYYDRMRIVLCIMYQPRVQAGLCCKRVRITRYREAPFKDASASRLQDLRLRLLHGMHMHMRGFCYSMTNFDALHPRVRHDVLDRKA